MVLSKNNYNGIDFAFTVGQRIHTKGGHKAGTVKRINKNGTIRIQLDKNIKRRKRSTYLSKNVIPMMVAVW